MRGAIEDSSIVAGSLEGTVVELSKHDLSFGRIRRLCEPPVRDMPPDRIWRDSKGQG